MVCAQIRSFYTAHERLTGIELRALVFLQTTNLVVKCGGLLVQRPAFFIDKEGQLCCFFCGIEFTQFIVVRHNLGVLLISLIVCNSYRLRGLFEWREFVLTEPGSSLLLE